MMVKTDVFTSELEPPSDFSKRLGRVFQLGLVDSLILEIPSGNAWYFFCRRAQLLDSIGFQERVAAVRFDVTSPRLVTIASTQTKALVTQVSRHPCMRNLSSLPSAPSYPSDGIVTDTFWWACRCFTGTTLGSKFAENIFSEVDFSLLTSIALFTKRAHPFFLGRHLKQGANSPRPTVHRPSLLVTGRSVWKTNDL